MLTIALINEAVKKMESIEHETKFVICTGKSLIENGMDSFKDEKILQDTRYLVELGNYPYSHIPTAVKPLLA